MNDDFDLVCPASIPAIDHQAHYLALSALHFELSCVEDVPAERGLDLSYETVRRWVHKFGPQFAKRLRSIRPRPTAQWHFDEMAVLIGGERFWLWRAVDSEGEVLDLLVQRKRDKAAAP